MMGETPLDDGYIEIKGVAAMIRQVQDPDDLKRRRNAIDAKKKPPFKTSELSEHPSGGELSRAAIAEVLSQNPDVILADEPTTNLDSDGVRELRRAFEAFKGAIVLVSHDRDLLDDLCDKIWELENGVLRVFPGNYSEWRIQKERERDFAGFEYEEYRREDRRLRESARKAKERSLRTVKPPSRMSGSEVRLRPDKGDIAQATVRASAKAISKRADKLEKKSRPADLPEIKMALGVHSSVASAVTARAAGLSAAFGDRTIFDDADFEVTTAKRTVLLGPNGSGKTTLIGLIARGEPPVKIAPGARIGYFGQNHESVDPTRTVLENARKFSDLPEHEVRTILARLEIKGEDAHKKCAVLSGGECAKVAFAMLFASNLNTLVLDEPTNHMDLYATEALESLLMAWKGTIVLATHDLRLAGKVGDRFLMIEDKKIRTFEGTLADFAAKR
jgi:ATPase subunit of ABC transporter with duplicated ATPase domains